MRVPMAAMAVMDKGRFFSESDGKILNLSNRHACEPKIVSVLLFPVHIVNRLLIII